jgi:hypothetical protein
MSHAGLDLTNPDLASRDTRLKINNDLQTISQALYLVDAELLSHQTRLKDFVQVAQSALHRLADTCACSDKCAPNSVSNKKSSSS